MFTANVAYQAENSIDSFLIVKRTPKYVFAMREGWLGAKPVRHRIKNAIDGSEFILFHVKFDGSHLVRASGDAF